MAPRAVAQATISFGLVSIPVKLFSSSKTSESISFRMLDGETNEPVKQQYIRPKDQKVVKRDEIVKGYEYAKGQFVIVDPEEIKALEEAANRAIAIEEFIPLDEIDGVYYEKAYYLAPDRGGARAYQLLHKALSIEGLGGVAKYAARGKQYLVVLRANAEGGLVMQQLRYPHEIREFGEVEIEDGGEVKDAELKLALQLIQAATSEEFHPEKYKDDVHVRLQELIQQKIEGQEVVIPEAEAPKAQVIDLMEALKASLSEVTKGSSGKGDGAERKPAKASPRKKAASKKTTKKKSTKKKAS